MSRLLKWGGALVVLAVVVAGVGYAAYKLEWFAGVDTETGEVATTNEADAPPSKPAAPPTPEPSWTTFRYDERRTGYNPRANVKPPFRVLWKRRLSSLGYLEGPGVVRDGILVIGSYGKRLGSDVTAYDARTGKTKWRRHFRHGANFAGSPLIYRGIVWITAHDGHIYAFKLKTGRLHFRARIAAAESPPIAKGNLLYFGDGPKGGNGTFRALDLRTNKVVWRHKAAGTISSGAALTDTTLYYSSYGGSVYALNRFTGKLRWRSSATGASGGSVPFYSTPAIGDGKVIVGGLDGGIYAFDARTGNQVWRARAGNYVYPSAAIAYGRVFIGDFSGNFYAFSLKNGSEIWRKSMGPIIGSATVASKIVYISSLRPSETYGFSAKTGKVIWKFPDGEYSPLIADRGRAWLMGEKYVYGLETATQARARRARTARARRARAATARRARAAAAKRAAAAADD